MNTTVLENARANWARLQEFVQRTSAADKTLRQRGERFARNLAARQDRNFAKILAKPGTKAYRDYVETPARFGVPAT